MKPLYFALSTVLIVLFVFGLIWLWQQQPNLKKGDTAVVEQKEENISQDLNLGFLASPKNNSAHAEKVKFIGKTTPNSLIAVFSNDIQKIIAADDAGNFSEEIAIEDGLNLINAAVISADFKKTDSKSLTLFGAKNTETNDMVFAGSVKNIFDAQFTITSDGHPQEIRTSGTTEIILPADSDEEEATRPALKNIRIGDFLIAIGKLGENNELLANRVEVIRENKPVNSLKVALADVLSGVRQNSIQTKNIEDEKIVEFTFNKQSFSANKQSFSANKNSVIFKDGNEAKISDVAKDKKAIIIFRDADDKKVVNLIYLLP